MVQIILVDDEPRIHEMVSRVLTQAELAEQLQSFYDPVSFLEYLKQTQQPPDLILLDVYFENSGLSGIEILPFIRKQHPYLPILLLTGMDGADIAEAQDYECLYFIPKPVTPEHLINMVRFYLGMGRKSGRRTAERSQDLANHKKLVQTLKKEIATAEISSWDTKQEGSKNTRGFQKIVDILATVLKNCVLLPSFIQDLEHLFGSDFKLLKNSLDTIIRFDISGLSSPGLNIHKYQGVNDVYSLRLTKKARLFFYRPQQPGSRKLRFIRLDPDHDTRGMDKWLKANHDTFSRV